MSTLLPGLSASDMLNVKEMEIAYTRLTECANFWLENECPSLVYLKTEAWHLLEIIATFNVIFNTTPCVKAEFHGSFF